ncbi:sensor histidine kinase [Nonomuraea jiangxiensis]|nr:histidine kinase [Nonomuraea jiangxiensis]
MLPTFEPEVESDAGMGFVAVAGLVAIAVRRRVPYVAVAVMLSALLSGYVLGTGVIPYLIGLGMALYTVGVQRRRRESWLTAVAVLAVVVTADLLAGWQDLWGTLVWAGLTLTGGALVRSQRAYVTAVKDRAARAEQARESEAGRRVAEERLQVARDVHDAIGHRIAVINVQSAVAAQLLRSSPEGAAEALEHVRQASANALNELGELLDVLRNGRSETHAAGLESIGELMDGFRAAGLAVDVTIEGRPYPLPLTTNQAAYRIVQESLTNALTHGAGGTASLCVAYRPGSVRIQVGNPLRDPDAAPVVRPAPLPVGGSGIIGMRERAARAGGTLRTLVGHGVFTVTVHLPSGKTR